MAEYYPAFFADGLWKMGRLVPTYNEAKTDAHKMAPGTIYRIYKRGDATPLLTGEVPEPPPTKEK